MSKVTNNLYIGNIYQAGDVEWLKGHGITHIVNATEEIRNNFPYDFSYKKLFLQDIPSQSLFPSMDESYQFIRDAISNGGKVFVHCYAGVSRSSSTVIYYLMKSRGWSYQESFNYLKQRHSRADPNPGFVEQLFPPRKDNMDTNGYFYNTTYPRSSKYSGLYY